MDWGDIAGKVIGLGAPILGSALGGPLGAAAGNILAEALGTAEPTVTAVSTALTSAATVPSPPSAKGQRSTCAPASAAPSARRSQTSSAE